MSTGKRMYRKICVLLIALVFGVGFLGAKTVSDTFQIWDSLLQVNRKVFLLDTLDLLKPNYNSNPPEFETTYNPLEL